MSTQNSEDSICNSSQATFALPFVKLFSYNLQNPILHPPHSAALRKPHAPPECKADISPIPDNFPDHTSSALRTLRRSHLQNGKRLCTQFVVRAHQNPAVIFFFIIHNSILHTFPAHRLVKRRGLYSFDAQLFLKQLLTQYRPVTLFMNWPGWAASWRRNDQFLDTRCQLPGFAGFYVLPETGQSLPAH